MNAILKRWSQYKFQYDKYNCGISEVWQLCIKCINIYNVYVYSYKVISYFNRVNFLAAEYIRDLIVSVSNRKPKSGSSPSFTEAAGYRRCGKYSGTPPAEEDIEIRCEKPRLRRYVYLHLAGTNHLHFCEVRVYGRGRFPGHDNEVFRWVLPFEMVDTQMNWISEPLTSLCPILADAIPRHQQIGFIWRF